MRINKQIKFSVSPLNLFCSVGFIACLFSNTLWADIIHNDDVIVEGRICSSDQDFCADGEDFLSFGPTGFQLELKLKDNSPAIGFEATGTNAADWVIGVEGEDLRFENDEINSRPFVIRNGAGTNALIVGSPGFVGVNEFNPQAALDVRAPFGEQARLQVINDGGTDGQLHSIINLESNGPPAMRFRDNFNDETWQFRAKQNGGFTIDNAGTVGLELQIERDGRVRFKNSVFVNGVLVHASSKSLKENIQGIDTRNILAKVNALPIQKWNYIRDNDGVKHLGPMAEDFYQAFKLGSTDKGISTVDVSGVAIAAIQGLKSEKDREITLLNQKIDKKDQSITKLKKLLEINTAQLQSLQRALAEKEGKISNLEASVGRLVALEQTMAVLIKEHSDGVRKIRF